MAGHEEGAQVARDDGDHDPGRDQVADEPERARVAYAAQCRRDLASVLPMRSKEGVHEDAHEEVGVGFVVAHCVAVAAREGQRDREGHAQERGTAPTNGGAPKQRAWALRYLRMCTCTFGACAREAGLRQQRSFGAAARRQ